MIPRIPMGWVAAGCFLMATVAVLGEQDWMEAGGWTTAGCFAMALREDE